MAQEKLHKLSVFLLKPEYQEPAGALKTPRQLKECPLATGVGFEGAFYLREPVTRVPDWVAYVQPGITTDLAFVTARTTSAVLFVRADHRVLVYAFGNGRNLLRPEAYERDFGLKVVLNTVDPRNLRSIDAKTVEELTVHTRKQTSRGSGLESFGLNVTQDLVRSVTGVPVDTSLASLVSGSSGLSIFTYATLGQLAEKSSRLLHAYQSTSYQESFAFVDHMRRLEDPKRVSELEDSMLDRLRTGNLDGFHLAPPEPVSWEDVDGFAFSVGSRSLHFDLSVTDYLGALRNISQLSMGHLKRHRVGVKYSSSESVVEKWTVRDCITFELNQGGALYILSGGDWFEVSEAFSQRVNQQVSKLAEAGYEYPPPLDKEPEADYNRRLAGSRGYALLDKALVPLGGTTVEVCDLYTPSKQFIHVKRRSASSTLSHLFSQGVTSAEAFVSDADYRLKAKEQVRARLQALAETIPDDRPTAGQYSVVYLILGARADGWPQNLPFFSRLNLKNAADRLMRIGYNVALARA